MANSVDLNLDGDVGVLEYSENLNGGVTYNLIGDSKDLKLKLNNYLIKEKEFNIPESQLEDDYRVDIAKPIDNFTYFELGLCTLEEFTGIKVIWPRGMSEKELEELIGD